MQPVGSGGRICRFGVADQRTRVSMPRRLWDDGDAARPIRLLSGPAGGGRGQFGGGQVVPCVSS